jgi:hypothetical protein
MSSDPIQATSIETAAGPEYVRELDPYKVREFQERLDNEQNLLLGLLAGGAAALLGAILWAAVTVITDYQIGWMAVGLGFLVGWAVRRFGRGQRPIFGLAGAGLALAGCILGNVLTAAVIISQQESVSLFSVLVFLLLSPGLVLELLVSMFSPMDLLFYGIALYEGYRFSFRQVAPAERDSLYRTRPLRP